MPQRDIASKIQTMCCQDINIIMIYGPEELINVLLGVSKYWRLNLYLY